MYKQGDACPLCGAGLLSEKVVAERFNYKGHSQIVPDFRILDLFPESLGVLPGVPRPLAVALRKGKRVEAGVVCEDDEGYAEFRGQDT